MSQINIVIVSPYSPRWSNIASVRWEKLSKYLSQSYPVSLITSSFPEPIKERSFDIGKTQLVEIPVKYYARNPFTNSFGASTVTPVNLFIRKIKAELRVLLERILPISSGGVLYHNLSTYRKEVEKRLLTNKRNVLITTYDPWFSLKLGYQLKKKNKNIVWIADFRDPSFNLHESRVSQLPIFRWHTKRILTLADLITVVTKHMQRDYEELAPDRVMFLPNGYDGDINLFKDASRVDKKKNFLSICYTGSLHPKTIEISYFVEALEKAIQLSSSIKPVITFSYAGFNHDIVEKEFSKRNLQKILINYGMLTRDESIKLQRNSDVLLLIVYTGDNDKFGRSIRTGKVYEYLASGKPIIAIAPEGWEMKDEIECDGVSKVFHKSQTLDIAKYLIELSQKDFIELNVEARKKVIEKYLYENLSKQLEKAIIEIVSNVSTLAASQ